MADPPTPSPSPNPNALKFTFDEPLPGGSLDQSSPLAQALLQIDGVAAVFGVGDFVTVTRRPDAEWEPIVAAVQHAAAEHLG